MNARYYGIPAPLTVWLSLVIGMLLSGCGYSIQRQSELPFTEVQIRTIENRTLEPKLQDKLYKALTEEFMKNGIRVIPVADTKISAVIHTFELNVLSLKQQVVVEYRVIIRADFTVEDKSGNKVLKSIESPFIISLTASGDLNTLLATKEPAEESALKDVAMKVVGALIYK